MCGKPRSLGWGEDVNFPLYLPLETRNIANHAEFQCILCYGRGRDVTRAPLLIGKTYQMERLSHYLYVAVVQNESKQLGGCDE